MNNNVRENRKIAMISFVFANIEVEYSLHMLWLREPIRALAQSNYRTIPASVSHLETFKGDNLN